MARRPRPPALTRSLIDRVHPRLPADDPAAFALLPESGLREALGRALAARPAPARDVWLFAYGSLIWKPDCDPAERRVAALRGWHRRFCLWQWRFRGTRERPGMMLALDRGGSCRGVAYRLAAPDLHEALWPVWRREMRGGGYEARWLSVDTPEGSVPALTFVANRAGPRYAGRLSDPEIAGLIADACGHVGPSAEYLLETLAHCEALGIRDRHLRALAGLVAERLSLSGASPA